MPRSISHLSKCTRLISTEVIPSVHEGFAMSMAELRLLLPKLIKVTYRGPELPKFRGKNVSQNRLAAYK